LSHKNAGRTGVQGLEWQGGQVVLDQLLDAKILYPAIIIVFAGAAELGAWAGRYLRGSENKGEHMGTLAGSALGLLALLLAFSFSLALSRYEARRALVLEEANAIGSTANFALMLPETAEGPVLSMLRDYAAVRIGLGVPYDPAKLDRDIAKSLDLQAKLWQQAVRVSTTTPQSLPASQFAASLDEMNKVHERRLMALRYHIPNAAIVMLFAVAIVAMVFTGYQVGLLETRLREASLVMAVMVGVVIAMVVDLDQPSRGLIQVSPQALVDVVRGIPP
jgi:hypothetical protein